MAAASMAGQASDLPTPPPERLAIPSRNPLPLSASQESQVRDIYYARVRKQCADEIKGQTAEPRLPPLYLAIILADIYCPSLQPLLLAPSVERLLSPLPAAQSTAP